MSSSESNSKGKIVWLETRNKFETNFEEKNTIQSSCQTWSKFYCEICELNLLSAAQLEQHSSGKKHLKKLNTNLNKNTSFRCDICDVFMISEAQLKSHILGKKHIKK